MPNNQTRTFDDQVKRALGDYVYALRDPRDNKVFYIGKGQGQRLFSHFAEADNAVANNEGWSAKLRRIVEIWEADEDVDWFIIRHNIASNLTSFDIEASIIDALEISQNGPALNEIAGIGANAHGILSAEDVIALAAQPVNPTQRFDRVFVFPIRRALAQNRSVYESTRSWWSVSKQLRQAKGSIAVGVSNGLSKGAFSIDEWVDAPSPRKYEFNGTLIENSELNNKSWLKVIQGAFGFFTRGNYLVVELNGQGQFRYVRGSSDQQAWHNLITP